MCVMTDTNYCQHKEEQQKKEEAKRKTKDEDNDIACSGEAHAEGQAREGGEGRGVQPRIRQQRRQRQICEEDIEEDNHDFVDVVDDCSGPSVLPLDKQNLNTFAIP